MAREVLEDRSVNSSASSKSSKRDIPFVFGIRGVSSIYVMMFHLNNIILAHATSDPPRLYHVLTDWIRYGDFRVAAFFVISGNLLTIPTTRSAHWALPNGIDGFLKRRAQRLLGPYYVAYVVSLVLFVMWAAIAHAHMTARGLIAATVTHALLIHNVFPQTMLLVNDTLWNVALEFQCYVLFAFVMLPLLRRYGPWRQFAIVLLASLVPHFLFHGFLDWMRLWFVALFALGVATMAISNKLHTELTRYEQDVPWGSIWVAGFVLTPIAIWASGIDASYGSGWLQNLLLGASVGAFLVYARVDTPGLFGPLARRVIRLLEFPPLRKVGAYSYSIYLIHFPILRLFVGIASRFTHSIWIVAGFALFVFVPITMWLSFVFHVRVERPFQNARPGPRRVAKRNVPMLPQPRLQQGVPASLSEGAASVADN